MEAPNEKEKQLLLEFRARITDLPLTDLEENDLFLITWIRARDHDLNRAEKMIRKHFDWRNTNGIDTMPETYEVPLKYSKMYPFEITGHDDTDCPVVVCKVGGWNIRKAIDDGEAEAFTVYLTYIARSVQRHVQKLIVAKGKFIPNIILVLDAEGYSYRQLASLKTVELYTLAIREFESNYPETLKYAGVINLNRGAVLAYNLLKPLLSSRTLAKAELYDSNAANWKAGLLRRIPAHALPVCYGGTNEHSKIFRSSLKVNDPISKYGKLTTVTVEAGDQFKAEFHVENPCTVLSWRFKVKKYDIGFWVDCNDRDVVHYSRFEASGNAHRGSILCDSIGKYSFIFDNKYSRFRSKTLEYIITTKNGVMADDS